MIKGNKGLKKNLMIQVDCEEINSSKSPEELASDINKLNLSDSKIQSNEILGNSTEESEIIKILRKYMEGGGSHDLSYEWITKDSNIQYLNKCIKTDLMNIKSVIDRRDLKCELELIKLMTEDKKHRQNLITLPRDCKKLNRYNDILPYRSNTTFICNEEDEHLLTDQNIFSHYVNGSYISGPLQEDEKLFIATQGPLGITIEGFWKLILKKEIKLLIMLSNLQEEGRKKCDQYWPSNISSPIVFEKFKITLENEDFILDKAVMQRNFIIHDEENCKKHNVTQLHVVCWPDHSIPEEESGYKAIDLLISYVDDYSNCYKSPIVTHCSAGVGRTGTFIAIYNICKCLGLINNNNKKLRSESFLEVNGSLLNKKEELETMAETIENIGNFNCNFIREAPSLPFFSVFNVVRKLREQRYGMVTDSTQYKFIYTFVMEWLNRNFEYN